jgi:hypothetical protein
MAIQDHYLPEDLDQLTDHLENLHKSTMGILEAATTADFTQTEQHQESIRQSLRVILALHNKKLIRDEHEQLNNAIYARRGWIKSVKTFHES